MTTFNSAQFVSDLDNAIQNEIAHNVNMGMSNSQATLTAYSKMTGRLQTLTVLLAGCKEANKFFVDFAQEHIAAPLTA